MSGLSPRLPIGRVLLAWSVRDMAGCLARPGTSWRACASSGNNLVWGLQVEPIQPSWWPWDVRRRKLSRGQSAARGKIRTRRRFETLG